jgi:hypothetical protein
MIDAARGEKSRRFRTSFYGGGCTQVRIGGWLVLAQEHPEQVGKTRGSLWEIHPITRIEVKDANGWRGLQRRPDRAPAPLD